MNKTKRRTTPELFSRYLWIDPFACKWKDKESNMAPTNHFAFLALSFLLSGRFAAAGEFIPPMFTGVKTPQAPIHPLLRAPIDPDAFL